MAVSRNRGKVWREKESISLDYTSLEDLRDEINSAISAYSDKAEVRKTSIPYSDSEYYAIFAEEDETDEEMVERIQAEEYREKSREAYELQQYELLKAKFEKE